MTGAARPGMTGSTRLRIAGVDPEKGFAGGEAQVLGLTIGLIRRGHDAHLICDPAGRLWERANANGIRCHPLRIRNSVDVRAALELRGILCRSQFDVVHFHTSRAHAMAPWVGALAGARVVTRRMDYRPNRLFARWLYNRAVDRVAAISGGVADSISAAGVDRDHIAVIPSGVDADYFAPPSLSERTDARGALGIGADEIVVGAVGALEPRKGHRFLIEAIARLRHTEDGGRVRCLIAGGGSLAGELAATIDRLELRDAVRLIGPIDNARDFLRAIDIFALPSTNEGLGVALLEAMATGLPAVASRVGGAAEAIVHGVTGYAVAPADADAIAADVGQLASSAGLRAAMGAAGRDRAVRCYALETTIDRTIELYRECIARRGREGKWRTCEA